MSDNLYTLKPDELIAAYQAELRRLYGDDYKTDIYHERGWYYIKRRAGRTRAYRRMKIIDFIESLRKREPEI